MRFTRRPHIEEVTVVVDEINVDEAKADLNSVADAAEKRIMEAIRKLDEKINESKIERGKLEAAVATARRRGQGRW